MERHPMSMGWLNIVKMAVLLKVTYRFSEIPIKISMAFFFRNGIVDPQIHKELQRAPIAKVILKKRITNSEDSHFPVSKFQIYTNQKSMILA